MTKYHNTKSTVKGLKFDSKKESLRYLELKEMEKRGEITELELQVKYDLLVNGISCGFYKCDFRYVKKGEVNYIIEDCKGVKTTVYALKKRLMKAIYKIVILET